MKGPESCKPGPIHEAYVETTGEETRTSCVLAADDRRHHRHGPIAIGPAIHVRHAVESGWQAVLLVAAECRENEVVPGLIMKHPVSDKSQPSLATVSRAIVEGWIALHSRCGLFIACGSGRTRAPVFAAALMVFLGREPSLTVALNSVRTAHERVEPSPMVERQVAAFVLQSMEEVGGLPFPLPRTYPGAKSRGAKSTPPAPVGHEDGDDLNTRR